MTMAKIPTLYLTRNGLLEPLGQSQVFSYLRGLSLGYQITLITYEKPSDWANTERVKQMQSSCKQLDIRWLPQRFHAQPKLIAPALSMLRMVWLLVREVRKQQVKLIHARSYIPAAVAMCVGRLLGVPFIFDMRALWPEELITAGRLRRGSLLHRAMVHAERSCLQHAAAVVSLTQAAAYYLKREYANELSGQKILVIPTCADLNRFVPALHKPPQRVIGCLGTVLSGWFRIDWLSAFLSAAAKQDPSIRFELTTLDNPEQVRLALGDEADLQERLHIAACASEQVHEVLQRQVASVMFFTQGVGKLGSSPTRMAEILGCGLPVVANEGVGDVADIIRQYRVGVLVAENTPAHMSAAWDELQHLLLEPDLAIRCREAAEAVFSLDIGTKAYLKLYDDVLSAQPSRLKSL
jgi:glycosyltransferase involved in cell wall biosynthesis